MPARPRPQTRLFSGIRRRWLVVALVAGALVLLVGTRVLREHVPMPPEQATAQEVVLAYTDAVHVGDCATADALVVGARQSWCGSIDIDNVAIGETTHEKRETKTGNGPQITRVWPEMKNKGGDGSVPEGLNQWNYLLDRVGPGRAWRIYDQGMG